MPRNIDFFCRPAPESEDDLEVPGQPLLGLLGILSEYYKYREPKHRQGKALGDALHYLYRVKKRTENGKIDENFGMEIMNAVNEVMVTPSLKTDEVKLDEGKTDDVKIETIPQEPSSSQPSLSKQSSQNNDFELDDFGFSSSEDELGSKIDSLVRMVKSTVKKKKKKKHKIECLEPTTSELSDDVMSIPKLKIKFGKHSCSDDAASSGAEEMKKSSTPMKLKIKLGAAVSNPPLLPPPPLLTLHKPTGDNLSPSTQLPALSPKYEPEINISSIPGPQSISSLPPEVNISSIPGTQTISSLPPHSKTGKVHISHSNKIFCSDEIADQTTEEAYPAQPPIKLTLRVQQPMRKSKGWISPRTEQLVNYIDDVTTFVNESMVMSVQPVPNMDVPLPIVPEKAIKTVPETILASIPPKISQPAILSSIPEPPKLKLAPNTTLRKRKRESSPNHVTQKPTAKSVIENNSKPEIPPLKLSKTCTSKNVKLKFKKKATKNLTDEKYWKCGIFSNSLKQNSTLVQNEELDFRSNILPIYCGINYLKKQFNYTLPYDIWLMNENNTAPSRQCPSKQTVTVLKKLLKDNNIDLPKLSECEYVFDQHLDNEKPKGRKHGKNASKMKKTSADTSDGKSTETNEREYVRTPSSVTSTSPCESPELVIQSDCDSPLPLPEPIDQNNCEEESIKCVIKSPFSEKVESTAAFTVPQTDRQTNDGQRVNRIQIVKIKSTDKLSGAKIVSPNQWVSESCALSNRENNSNHDRTTLVSEEISQKSKTNKIYDNLQLHLQDREICNNNVHSDRNHASSDSEISFEDVVSF